MTLEQHKEQNYSSTRVKERERVNSSQEDPSVFYSKVRNEGGCDNVS